MKLLGCPLGVMQGRLLPKYRGRYQAHPVGYWRDEFPKAAELGLDLIEFIADLEDIESNPLLSDPAAIARAADSSGVEVRSICADCFMAQPLHRDASASALLIRLIEIANRLGVRDIVVPCVDDSSLNSATAKDAFVSVMREMAPAAQTDNVNLALETDLAPREFVRLLERIGSPAVTVNYDSGNSAALGYDPHEEFAAYGALISDIHIKDRTRGGGPVMLGEGDCDFDALFDWIGRSGYRGPLIMQAWRDDEGLAVFRRQLAWLRVHYEPGSKVDAA